MEPDSTTHDPKSGVNFPFHVQPSDLKLYMDLIRCDGEGSSSMQLVQQLQNFGLLPETVHCEKENCKCQMICKSARVVDKVQWMCESCDSRLPIRTGSFFLRLQCSMLQVLQIILAWCEDADWEAVAKHFEIKSRVVWQLYEKLEAAASAAHAAHSRLGGAGAVVLAEMFPDCLTRLSPDTSDQPRGHRILMLADTKHIPTRYWLHVLKQDPKKAENSNANNKAVRKEVESVVEQVTAPGSLLVAGAYVPSVPGACALQTLLLNCDTDMRHFLCERIWRQAVILCSASRSVPSAHGAGGTAGAGGAGAAQRYLDAALYRLRHPTDLFHTTLRLLADTYTLKESVD